MRQIKFRGWDKKNKSMIDHNRFFRLDCSNEEPFLALLENKSFDMEVEIMQYIGLKDINGVEIYEGDIVKDRYGEKFEIQYCNESCAFGSLLYAHKEFYFLKDFENVQLIGNIYENPELLEV